MVGVGLMQVVVLANGYGHAEAALAEAYGWPIVSTLAEGMAGLRMDEHGLSVIPGDLRSGPVQVDFVAGKSRHRRMYGGGKGQQIAKAVGVQGSVKPSVLDLTAGLGGDAFVLASLGCHVYMAERQPVVRALLEDGLRRLCEADQLVGLSQLMQLVPGSAMHAMAQWQSLPPQVIYLDPMFPHSRKSAQVKKEMALFRDLVGADTDAHTLLAPALALASHRVVVKRPRLAPDLDEQKPTYSLTGKANRFDIYVRQSFKA